MRITAGPPTSVIATSWPQGFALAPERMTMPCSSCSVARTMPHSKRSSQAINRAIPPSGRMCNRARMPLPNCSRSGKSHSTKSRPSCQARRSRTPLPYLGIPKMHKSPLRRSLGPCKDKRSTRPMYTTRRPRMPITSRRAYLDWADQA